MMDDDDDVLSPCSEDAESDSSTSDNEEQPGSSKAIVKRPAFYGSVLGMWRLQSSEFFDEFLQDLGTVPRLPIFFFPIATSICYHEHF